MGELNDNAMAGRLEMVLADQVVFADYRRLGDRLVIDHVEAPPSLRGTGAAGAFMQALADHARRSGLRITPLCGYAAAWLRRRPEHRDLIA
jgi:predicted GNAT family acetyltransferase